MLDQWKTKIGNHENEENNKWLKANSKKCPNCQAPIQKNDGCNHIKCTSCSYMFCWLCMGGPDEHPGSSPDHIAQCNNEQDVINKGRLAQMEAAKNEDFNFNTPEAAWLTHHNQRYLYHKDMAKQTLLTKEDALAKIDHVLEANEGKTIDDFKFFFNALALQEIAHNALANSYVLRYY